MNDRNICKLIFLVLSVNVAIIKTSAQNSPYTEVSIASPTAASLGKFVDVPVNYHTGIPQINIPIYTVKEGPLSLPVSLSYHASGLKVIEPASWVGAGWTLNAGGVITRTMRGAPDERSTTAVNISGYGHFSDYGYSSYLDIGNGGDPNDYEFSVGGYDGEPDLFFFNFAGYTGKFYFSDDRTPVLLPDQNFRIEYYYPMDTAQTFTMQGANIQGFIITTTDGTKYYFGINSGGTLSGADPVEVTFPYSAHHEFTSDRVISSWYLNKIVSPDGVFTINLIYDAEAYSYYTISMYHIPSDNLSDVDASNDVPFDLAKNYIEGVRLSQVSFSNGGMEFIPAEDARTDLTAYSGGWVFEDYENTEAKALASIAIYDDDFCKKFLFDYSYFEDNSSDLPPYLAFYDGDITSDTRRLKLNSIQEENCDETISPPPYVFDYAEGLVPRRLSFAQDYWGFYNGADGNNGSGVNTLVPTYTISHFTSIEGADRTPGWPDMKNGTLEKITYPTGGSTTFEYEPNDTWVSTTRYTTTSSHHDLGNDGNDSYIQENVHFTNNHYQLSIVNNIDLYHTTYAATVWVKNEDNETVAYLNADPGETRSIFFQIPNDYYTIEMYRYDSYAGPYGASVTFTEMVPGTVSENTMVGGLRIKTITQSDNLSPQNDIVTSYSYRYNDQSTGVLYGRPVFVQVIRNDEIALIGMGGTTNENPNIHGCLAPETFENNNQPYYIAAAPIMPMTNSQGNHIGYSEVKVSRSGNGYSIYRYWGSDRWDTNTDDIAYLNVNIETCTSDIPSMPAPPLPFEYQRGELKWELHFDEHDRLLKEIWYLYEFDSSKIATPGYMVTSEAGFLVGTSYTLRTYWKKQAEAVETDYDIAEGSIQTIKATAYESPYHHAPTRQTVINSKGETIETDTKYAFDYRVPDCDELPDGWEDCVDACNACATAYDEQLFEAEDLDDRHVARADYALCLANARKDFIAIRRTNFTDPDNEFSGCHTGAKGDADAVLKPVLQLQDDNINSPVEVTSWKESALTSAYFYTYDYADDPEDKVYINSVQKIPLTEPDESFTASASDGSEITKDERYEEESVYKFSGGNPAEATNRDGITKSYIWDYNHSLPAAVAVNATTGQIAYASFETDATGSFDFSGTIITNEIPPTGKNCYDLESGAIEKTGLDDGKTYIVSYWTKNGDYSVSGTVNEKEGKTIGDWTYYEHTVTGETTIEISGNGYIDEVRLYPANAQMVTYTYEPLIGMTSQCDVNNRISYYEYDGLGRLRLIRDQDKNILKKICYNYAGQEVNCDPNP